MSRRYRRTGPARFDDYHEIEAKFDSVGKCGHEIKKGDVIGYAPRTKEARCNSCWQRWVGENEAADFDEQVYSGGYGQW
jgi:hypothetical protein